MIAARNCGASARLIEEACDFAKQRQVSGEALADKQLVQAMLADSVSELWAARLITFEAAEAHDRGEDVKSLHARCSVAKLYASEAAGREALKSVCRKGRKYPNTEDLPSTRLSQAATTTIHGC